MDTIKIHVLHCGTVVTDKTLPFNENTLNPLAFTGLFRPKSDRVVMPVSAYLIEHPKGLVLLDTGWHTDVRINQKKYLGPILYQVNKAYLPEGEAIHEQLEQLGYKPSDLDYVILSHLDCDHASGLKHVSEAKQILTNKLEFDAAKHGWPRYDRDMWKGVNLQFYDFKPSESGPKKLAYDLFGDGSLQLLLAPGHSKGMVITQIKRNDRFILLSADCGYAQKSWQQMIMPGVVENRRELTESLEWMKKQAADPNCVEALACHDAGVKPHIIEL